MLFIAFSLFAFTPSTTVQAATGINHQINFQGKLVSPTGVNVSDGAYSIVFSIYNVSSAGSAIWTETQTPTVTNGIFQVSLGSVTALPGSVDFNTDNIYLGIKVGADAEMTPRIQFTSVPQAFNSEKLGGLDKTGFIQNQTGSAQVAGFNINGAGTIGTSLTTPLLQAAAATALTITGNAASTWSTSAGNITLQAGSGTISFGSTTSLTASGALSITSASGANAITLDSGSTGAVNIGTNAIAKTITLGNTAGASSTIIHMGTGGLSLGDDAVTGTINIGGVTTNGADTINIATNASTQDAITIGSTHASSTSKLQAGASSVAVANGGVTIQTTTNSSSAFQVQNSAGGSVLTSSTTDSSLTINQGGLYINGLANPSTPTLASVVTTGTLAAATYYYRLSAVGPAGETVAVASSPASVTTAGSTSKNTITWTAVTGATSYTVYRSTDNATWFYNTIASPTVTLVDNGSTYAWATSGTPNLYYNLTGRVQLNPGAPVIFDGPAANASIRYDQTSKNVTFTNINAGGAMSVQADSFVFQDTTGYAQDFIINNGGAVLFKNRANSINSFQIQPSGSGTSVLDVDTTNSLVGIGTNTPAYKLDVAGTTSATTFNSTQATGTAPFTVASTTKVTNLNADLLDGLDSTAFGDATAANQTTILNRIGTNADAAGTTTLFARLTKIDDTDIGSSADAANSSGTIFARLTDLFNRVSTLNTNVGSDADAASATGSVHAKLKDIKATVSAGSGKTMYEQDFSSGGTWTRPAGVNTVEVVCIGGGGGGGGGFYDTYWGYGYGGGGGGGGAYVDMQVIVAGNVSVTVGAGGTGGTGFSGSTQGTNTAGGTGGTSSFGGAVACAGGGGGGTGYPSSGTSYLGAVGASGGGSTGNTYNSHSSGGGGGGAGGEGVSSSKTPDYQGGGATAGHVGGGNGMGLSGYGGYGINGCAGGGGGGEGSWGMYKTPYGNSGGGNGGFVPVSGTTTSPTAGINNCGGGGGGGAGGYNGAANVATNGSNGGSGVIKVIWWQ